MNNSIQMVLPFLSVLALATAACQGPSPTAPIAPAAPGALAPAPGEANAATGTLQIDTRALFARSGGRRVLDIPAVGAIRVRVTLPESTTAIVQTITGENPAITLRVPPGLNRLVELEAMAGDRPVKRVAAIATVTEDGTTAVSPNYGTTAAADTLGLLIARTLDTTLDQDLLSKLKTALTTFDFEPLLMGEVLDETDYHPGMNVYKQYNPVYFPTYDLVDQILEYLGNSTSMEGFEAGGLGQLSGGLEVHLGGVETGASVEPAEITVLDPEGQTESTTDGVVSFSGVAPGTWPVYATQGSQEAWGTVTVHPYQADPLVELTFPGKVPLSRWAFRDELGDGWGFGVSNGLDSVQAPFASNSDGPVLLWSVPGDGAPAHLTLTQPGGISFAPYRYLAFKSRASGYDRYPFTVRLLDSANNQLATETFLMPYSEGPMGHYFMDLTGLSDAERGAIFRVVFDFSPEDANVDFWLDDMRFTQVGPQVMIDETQ